MKKKQISIETLNKGVKVDALCVSPANVNTLGAVLELAPVGSQVVINIDEVEIPDFPQMPNMPK